MKILLAVDGSDYTRKMLAYVRTNHTLFDPSHEYALFYAQAPLPPHPRAVLGSQLVHQYYEEEANKVLQPALAQLNDSGLKVSHSWKVGPAGETIANEAREGEYDLVIMGTHGHGSLGRLIMGSVTTQVLAQCTVPVLLVR